MNLPLLLDSRRDPQRAERLAMQLTEALGEPYWINGESLLIGCSLAGPFAPRQQCGHVDVACAHRHTTGQKSARLQLLFV